MLKIPQYLISYLPVRAVLFCMILIHTNTLLAQRTGIYEDETRIYQRGLELFDKEKYSAAQKHFNMFTERCKDEVYVVNSKYYAAVCAMELANTDAVKQLLLIVKNYPQYNKSTLAKYQLGRYYYRNKDNKRAIFYLNQVNDASLTGNDLLEFNFVKGYCNFKMDRFEESYNAFKSIKDQKTKYYDAANYYYAYVCYKQNNYDEALEHFGRVKHNKTFGPLSNIYVAQIYFTKKDYPQVIAYCDTITNKEVAIDVAGILGQSYYILGNYSKALPYLEKFTAEAPTAPTRNDYYRLAYSYKVNKQYEKAIENYLRVADEKDTLAQYSLVQLGICWLALDKKPNARSAFDKAYSLGFIASLNEEALFNSAKLGYDLSSNSGALTSLSLFIEKYPKSKYIGEAKSLISSLLLTSKNYKEAIRILESIADKDDKDLTILQKVYYYRAEELYLQNDYIQANTLFNKVINAGNFERQLIALSHFWLAEIAYKETGYANAINQFKKAQQIDEFKATRFYNISLYSIAYCYLKTDDYANAIEYFKKYTEQDVQMANPEVYTDAATRTADCYFASANYNKAIDYYNLVINKDLNGSDYAMYQKAMILGVVKKPNDKIAALTALIGKFPKSVFIDDALFERADEHLKSLNYAEALAGFNNIINNYQRSAYIRKSYMNKGLTLFNMGKDEEAMAAIKILATTYNNSDESRQGLVILKNILVGKGESETYLEFIKGLPNVTESASAQDSLTFQSAFANYQAAVNAVQLKDITTANKEYAKASKGFGNYITRFAGGYFTAKVYYYKAESDNYLKAYDDALVGYEYTANNVRSDYTERSTRQCAVIYFVRKNYEKAFEYYAALERIAGGKDNLQVALLGQLRCATILQKMDTATQVSFRYVNSSIATKEGLQDAKLNIARFYMNRNKPDSAFPEFTYLLKENKGLAIGAEAKYNLALIQFLRKEYKASTKTINELNDAYSAFEYWVAKGFILMADIYWTQKDYFQAKATLQSIIEETTKPDLKAIAQDKLVLIEEEESRSKNDLKKKIDERVKSREN